MAGLANLGDNPVAESGDVGTGLGPLGAEEPKAGASAERGGEGGHKPALGQILDHDLTLTPEMEARYPFDETAVYSCALIDFGPPPDSYWTKD